MANTYTQLYIHFVFAVKERYSLISKKWRDELFKYISGIIKEQGHKIYAINGMPDHIHILVSMNPKQSPSDLMMHVKKNSSAWINSRRLVMGRFSWQEGYGAFSYSKSHIPTVANYITNQESHHTRKSFREEYIQILESFGIEYSERYIFREPV
jgi:REP element-mobilizing transposase RayT